MRIKSSWRIALFLLLIGLLLKELLPITGIALSDSDNEVIVSFDMPVTEIIVPLGTETEDIPLPGTLSATLEGEGDTAADIPVIWEDIGLYNKEAAGTYLFTADIGTWIYAQARPAAIVTVVPPGIQISGKLWLDEDDDGIKGAGETGIAGYPVTLFAEGDLNTPVQTTLTKTDGGYRFEDMEPGSYVVKVTSETVGETEYLLPLTILNDNKFAMDEEAEASWSPLLEIGEDALISGIDAGMRLPVGIMPFTTKDVSTFEELEQFLYSDQIKSGDIIVIKNDILFTDSLTINKDLELTFKAADDVDSVILTCKEGRHFKVGENIKAELIFEDVVLDGGGNDGGGGILILRGELVLRGAEIRNCYSAGFGGGVSGDNSAVIENGSCAVSMFDCKIYSNIAGNSGGGVSATNAQLTITDCKIYENEALSTTGGGGGVSFGGDHKLTVQGSQIYGNTSVFMGGGILAAVGDGSSIIDSELSGNKGEKGGGIYIVTFGNAVATISDSDIFDNQAREKGGGIYCGELTPSKIVITGSSNLKHNSAADGGGIYANNSTVTLDDSSIFENEAVNDGGGIYTTDLTKLFVSADVIFDENTASMAARPLQNMKDKYFNIATVNSSIYGHPLNNFDINVLVVTVHYIDGGGSEFSIDELTLDRFAVALNDPFLLPNDEVIIPFVSGRVFTGWKTGSAGQKNDLPVNISSVMDDMDIYLVYERRIVTVSQEVDGDYADKTKKFQFTISFTDNNGDPLDEGTQFQYTTASDLEAEDLEYEWLILEEGGKYTFSLGNGEQISIVAVSQRGVQVRESAGPNYTVSLLYRSLVQTNDNWDTEQINLADIDIRLDFINTRKMVVPAGVLIGNIHGPALLALSVLLLMGIISAGMIQSRRKRGL